MRTRELELDEMRLVLAAMRESPPDFASLNQRHFDAHARLDELRRQQEELYEELRSIEMRMLAVAKVGIG